MKKILFSLVIILLTVGILFADASDTAAGASASSGASSATQNAASVAGAKSVKKGTRPLLPVVKKSASYSEETSVASSVSGGASGNATGITPVSGGASGNAAGSAPSSSAPAAEKTTSAASGNSASSGSAKHSVLPKVTKAGRDASFNAAGGVAGSTSSNAAGNASGVSGTAFAGAGASGNVADTTPVSGGASSVSGTAFVGAGASGIRNAGFGSGGAVASSPVSSGAFSTGSSSARTSSNADSSAPWYDGKILMTYDLLGIVNVKEDLISGILNKYINKEFNDTVFAEIQSSVQQVEGVDYFKANVTQMNNGHYVKLTITIYEIPMISKINFKGNEKIRTTEITEALTTVNVGKFHDPSLLSFKMKAIEDVRKAYEGKGFDYVNIDVDWTTDDKSNTVALDFTIHEGVQTRVAGIVFSGSYHVSDSTLKKAMSQKVRNLFTNGFYDEKKIEPDKVAIKNAFATQGYIDAEVVSVDVQEVATTNEKFREVVLTYYINEGEQWLYGGMNVSGNTVFSDEDLAPEMTLRPGIIINMNEVNAQIMKVTDVYYNNGYIGCAYNVSQERDKFSHYVIFNVELREGRQSHVEKILITGLTKTEESVMKREITLKEGQIFSKADLITSAQNIYNTGLLTDINYDIYFGEEENGVVVEFKVKEGNQMDIQFGATFGGNVDGFPVSGFLSWANHNFLRKAYDIGISTNLSPDAQTVSFNLGSKWFKNVRWSNVYSLNFSHRKIEGELQKAPESDYYDGRNYEKVYPLGVDSYAHWKETDGEYPSSQFLMDYRLFTVGLSWNSGYTWIWNPGRLSVNGGPSISINKAIYDEKKYDPFEKLTSRYHDGWKWSNKLSVGVTWDGRDYIQETTKGYVLNTSFTYAGGFLGGLSNYNKFSTGGAFYHKIATFGKPENRKNLMFCVSSNASWMLKQYYNNSEDNGWGWHDPHLGATKYEMLYIDGMTIARGHNIIYDQVFLWDNMVELSYPLLKNVLNAEVFASATAIKKELQDNKLNWYFAAGFGVKLKISGFPLGFYLVKNGVSLNGNSFSWTKGSIFNSSNRSSGGMKFVLAISTSLI